MLFPKLTILTAAAVIFSMTATAALAHDIDDCVLEKTYDCLDDTDFWGCYDFILEGCQSHGLPHAQADLNKLKAKARIIFNKSLATRG
jgi:hypothetical protein